MIIADRQTLALAWNDLRQVWPTRAAWRAFALNDIKQRHRRALLGRWWIVIAMAVTISMIGVIYTTAMGQPPGQHMPYIAVGMVIWYFLASVLTECPLVFIGAEGLIKAVKVPKVFFVARMIFRHSVIFAGNLSIIVVVYVIFPPQEWRGLLFAPLGFFLLVVNLAWMILLFGTLAVRYRDVVPLSASAVQVLFLVTPVIYRPEQLGASLSWLAILNPLASLVAVVRDPLLGQPPAFTTWLICAGMAVCGWIAAFLIFARGRSRIVTWL